MHTLLWRDSQKKMPRTSTLSVEVYESLLGWEEEGCQNCNTSGKNPPRTFSLTSTNSLSLLLPSTSFKPPPSTGWGSTIGSFLSARALKLQTPSNMPTTARPSDASSMFPHVAPPIHEQFGEAEASPLFNATATPATSPSLRRGLLPVLMLWWAQLLGQKVCKFLRRKMAWLSMMFLAIFDNYREG